MQFSTRSGYFTASGFAVLLMLVSLSSLGGCQQTQTTLTGGTDGSADATVLDLARELCAEAWRPVTYSSRDTPETQISVRANNAAREEYCKD